jgi:predicted restriction endonuclease
MKHSMWKCRAVEGVEIQIQDSHASHRPWKSLRDSHISTRTTIPPILFQGPDAIRKSVTYVLGSKCYLCPRPVIRFGTTTVRDCVKSQAENQL